MNINLNYMHILTIILVILKATNHIDWSWIWVFAPTWISWSFSILITFIITTIVLIKK